jgi:chemotaxis protein methyltransferase CheR
MEIISAMELSNTIKDSWIQITDEEYNLVTAFVYKNIGINLSDQKKTLLMGRLQKILRSFKFTNFSEYYNYLLNDKTGSALSELATAISTNHTFFYRESDHFDFFFHTTLPKIEEQLKLSNSNDIRIWSAGCSSGEEPFTLIMLMKEYFGNNYSRLNAGVLATDISEKALSIAKEGIYTDERVKPLPEVFKKKYFKKLPSGDWQISEEIKKEVTFRKFNLMSDVFPFKKKFHTIFCRNVMIYFDTPTRNVLVEKFYNMLLPDSYFFIGHSETLNRQNHRFKFIMPALYQK